MITYSFIIPHKNTPELLQRCLNSIPKRKDVEIIVVDDNSDDDKKPILERDDVTLLKITPEETLGAGKARNVGIEQARGLWMLFADADDYYNDGIFDILEKYKESDADVVYFNHQVVKDGLIVENPYPYVNKYKNEINGDDIDEVKFRFNVPWNKMVQREFIAKNHIVFEETPVGNDIFYSYQVGYFSENVIIEKTILYNYVLNYGSTIRKKNNSQEFYFHQFRHLFQCNEFLKYIGHPQWQKSIVGRFAGILYKRGLSQCLISIMVLLKSYNRIVKDKYYFVNEIESRVNAKI